MLDQCSQCATACAATSDQKMILLPLSPLSALHDQTFPFWQPQFAPPMTILTGHCGTVCDTGANVNIVHPTRFDVTGRAEWTSTARISHVAVRCGERQSLCDPNPGGIATVASESSVWQLAQTAGSIVQSGISNSLSRWSLLPSPQLEATAKRFWAVSCSHSRSLPAAALP